MTTLQKIYEKNNIAVQYKRAVAGGNDSGAIHQSRGGVRTLAVSLPSRYIHAPSTAANLEEKYYSSDKPIIIKKKDLKVKKKGYILYRFFNLEYAPEEYLIRNGYEIIETGC